MAFVIKVQGGGQLNATISNGTVCNFRLPQPLVLNAGIASIGPSGVVSVDAPLVYDSVLKHLSITPDYYALFQHTHPISQVIGLQDALDTKLSITDAASTYYLASNPAGYITASALTPYETSAHASSTYATQTALSTGLAGKANTVHTHDASAIVSGTLDIARIPVIPSQVQVVSTQASISQLTPSEQAQITGAGVIVTTTDGRRWVYSGSGSKTSEASYVELADITPDWNSITGKPSQYPPSAHTHIISDVTGLQDALNAKLDSATAATTYYPLNSNPAGYLTAGYNPFNQTLNTTDTVSFNNLYLNDDGVLQISYSPLSAYSVTSWWGMFINYPPNNTQTFVYPTSIGVQDMAASYATAITSSGIQFSDGTFQATAATAGSFLPLAGGNMTGAIYFGTGGQNINQGTFDNGTGGNNGISLNCAVGYELNWQGGHLKCVDQYGNPNQIQLDSQLRWFDNNYYSQSWVNANDFAFINGYGYGKSLYWDGYNGLHIYNNNTSISDGMAVSTTGITFPDGSYQSTAAANIQPVPYVDGEKEDAIPLVFNAGTRLWTDATQNGGRLRIASDFVNDSYISLQSNSGVTAIQVADGVAQKVLSLYANGIQFSDGTLQTTAATTPDLSGYLLKTDAATTYYPLSSNPAGYLTSSALSGYETSSHAASTYQTIAGMSGYLTTTAAAATYFAKPTGTTSQYIRGDGSLSTFSTDVTSVTNGVYLTKANNLSDLTSASTARTNLGLGTAAVQNTSYWIQSPAVAATDGQIPIWDSATSRAIWSDNNARTLFATVRNASGVTMPKGSIVYITGGTGNHAIVSLARANAESTSARTFGILSADLPNNTDGTCIVAGYLSGVDTSLWVEGTQLYLSPDIAGAWTSTKPSAPNHMVYVAKVTRQQSQQGTVEVTIQNGYELDELHNVSNTSLADKDLLVYESATSLWKNKSFSTLDLLTVTTAASTYFAKPTGTTSQYLRGDGSLSTFSTDALSATSGTYLAKASNLSDLANTATARTNLGLGTAATLSSSAVAQTANNLSDLASASTARTNLGLGTAATLASSAVAQTANNLSDLASASTARTNLGLGSIALKSSLASTDITDFSTAVPAAVPSASTSTAGKVQLATNAEAITGTDTAKAVTAAGVATEVARKFARRRFQTPINTLSTQVNGTGAGYTQVQQYCNISGGNAGVAGFARGYEIVTHPDYGSGFDWAKSIGFGAFFVVSNYSAYAGTYVRCGIGYTSAPTAGVEVTNFTARGIGFYWAQGGNLFLHVHDGTTLRSIDTGYAPTTLNAVQKVYAEAFSDGAGNVTAYVRVTNSSGTGSTISEYTATSANGPTGALAASPNNGYLFQVVTGTTHTSVLNVGSLHPTFFCD